jgi:hypothetical protein
MNQTLSESQTSNSYQELSDGNSSNIYINKKEETIPQLELHNVRIVKPGTQLNYSFFITNESLYYVQQYEDKFKTAIKPEYNLKNKNKMDYKYFRGSYLCCINIIM